MKIIIDLMEAYSDHLNLPLLFVNLNSNLEYFEDRKNRLARIGNLDGHLSEMKHMTTYLMKSTILSVSDKDFSASPHYIVTPHFKVNGSDYFIAAGPYWIKNDNDVLSEVNAIDEQEIAIKLKKIQQLFVLLTIKEKVEKQITFPQQFLNKVKAIIKCDPELNFQQYAKSCFDELVKLEDLDFLGIALKDSDDVFKIEIVEGLQMGSLLQKRFFHGEGLLGRTAILARELFWSESIDYQGADFFNRYGIFPKHIFAYPLKNGDVVEGILFAGNFNESNYNERLLSLLNIVVEHINEKRIMEEKLLEANVISRGFEQLADIINMLEHMNNEYVIEQKIVDLFDVLNYRSMVYTASYQKEMISIGNMTGNIKIMHQLARQNRNGKCYWHEGPFIHIDLKNYGFYTMEFSEAIVNSQRIFTIFSLLEKVLTMNAPKKQLESVFDVLHDSMAGINLNQYKLSIQALKIVQQWLIQQKIKYKRYQVLTNLCSVLPYSLDFLEKKISKTEEWSLLMEAQKIVHHKLKVSQMSMEGKMIAFLYNKLIRKVDDFSFLSSGLYEQFIDTYNHCYIDEVFTNREKFDEDYNRKTVDTTLPLTTREKEVLPLLIEGLNNKQVAENLNISIHTVKNHVTSILKKLNVTDRIQLMAKVLRIQNNQASE